MLLISCAPCAWDKPFSNSLILMSFPVHGRQEWKVAGLLSNVSLIKSWHSPDPILEFQQGSLRSGRVSANNQLKHFKWNALSWWKAISYIHKIGEKTPQNML
jgi:hypothetical protein